VLDPSIVNTCLKRKNNRSAGTRKTKDRHTEALHELDNKCKQLKTDISSLLSISTELYEKCEKSGNVTFVTKANALHRTAENKLEVDTLDKEIAEHLLAARQ